MVQLLKRIIYHTKDNIVRNSSLIVKLGCMLIAAFLLSGLTASDASASTGIKIYDYFTKKTTYTGTPIKVTCNENIIGNSKYPGIIVDGYALLPFYDIFDLSPIDADCKYDSKKGTLTISKYGNTIKMTLGSKKATVNGKAYTLPVAPRRIKYTNTNKIKVLVPSRFVAENLGLTYTWHSSTKTIAIVKNSLQLSYNNGEKFEYTGTQGKVIIDEKSLNLTKSPSIIINNTAMLAAYNVFSKGKMDVKYKYDKAKGTVTLSRDGNVLVMTLGSKTAYLNKKAITLSVAPIYVTNYDSNTSYVMVPGSITATSLGLSYQWNKSTRTSVIKTKSSSPIVEEPELGDSGDISETGVLIDEWTALDTEYGLGSGIYEINNETAVTTEGVIFSVYRDYNNTKQNLETFTIQANSPFSKVTSSKSGNVITLQADNMGSLEQIYDISSNLVRQINTYNQSETLSSKIELELLIDNYDYDISLSADQQLLYITVYSNTLINASIGTNDMGDYLILRGIRPLGAQLSDNNGFIYVDIPNTMNSIGDIYSDIEDTKYIKEISTISSQNNLQLLLLVEEGYQYSIKEKDNQFILSLISKDSPSIPTTPTIPTSSTIPWVSDKSKYEIKIPKAAELTPSMIFSEDFYYKNYFEVYLTGDFTNTINTEMIINSSKTVKDITVSLNKQGNTVIKITTSKLQGYELAYDNEYLYVNIGNPRDIYKNIVVLDPGHGGGATGAKRDGINEKDINLKILYTLGKKYFNQDTSKLKVYYTRTSDVDMTLKDRAAFASKVGADLFVSLHMNAAVNAPNAKGTEVFYSKNNNTANKAGLTSQNFAGILNDNLVNALNTNNRGVKQNTFTVINKNTVPAVLIELGFMTNSGDLKLMTDEAKQEITAQTIYNTLLQVFDLYPTGRKGNS